jgi:hypothetical protein
MSNLKNNLALACMLYNKYKMSITDSYTDQCWSSVRLQKYRVAEKSPYTQTIRTSDSNKFTLHSAARSTV